MSESVITHVCFSNASELLNRVYVSLEVNGCVDWLISLYLWSIFLIAPRPCSETTKNVLLASAYVNLCCKESTKFTKGISSLCKRVLLSGPAGITIALYDHQSFQLATFGARFI